MASSAISFQGVTSGLQTDQLVAAIIASDGQAVQRLKDKQTFNTQRATALQTMSSDMTSLSTALAALEDGFNARSITSTDTNNTYVTASATSASSGSYEIKVASVASKGQIAPTMSNGAPTNLAVADPAAAIATGAASFAVEGTDGVLKTFQLNNNSLNGLRDAINSSGAGVTATIINSGKGANPYQLVVTAKDTGTGATGGMVTLAAINNADGSATSIKPSLGITAGTLTGTFDAPTGITGGLTSSGDNVARDAVFTVNGIELTRKTNVVTDAVSGVTFTLKKGDATNDTTLSITQDKSAATTALQNVLTKYNTLVSNYKTATSSTKDTSSSTGDVIQGPLSNDATARTVMAQIRSTLMGSATGLPGTATYSSTGSIGIKTATDGTLSLDTTIFQAALDKDPDAVKKVFTLSGTSTNGAVSMSSGGSKTMTGGVDFNITNYASGGAVAGTFTVGGTSYNLSGSNGSLVGAAGTPLEGLSLTVSGKGTGTLNISRGVGQTLQDLVLSLTSYTGSMELAQTNITNENKDLSDRIDSGQALLDKRQTVLKNQFAKMESDLSQMRSLSSSLSGA